MKNRSFYVLIPSTALQVSDFNYYPAHSHPLFFTAGVVPDNKICGLAWIQFQRDYPKTYLQILKTWEQVNLLESGTATIASRAKEFDKHWAKLLAIVSSSIF